MPTRARAVVSDETRYNPLMVKRFLQMLIVALTLQLTWSVASAYCLHETGEASQHFGHHKHQHQSSNVSGENDDDSSAPGSLGGDPDCASCSHSPANIVPFSPSLQVDLIESHDNLLSRAGQPAPFIGAPERPQWVVAA